MDSIGYAVVGTGYFGAELARIMAKNPGAEIRAVYDPQNAEAVAKELRCEAATDLDALLARPDIQAVIVASPNYLHKQPVLKAAANGKHVFCEKPIALSYADCDEMVQACEKAGVTFMAGHVMHFFRSVGHAKRLIADGVLGEVLYCHSARNGWEEPQPAVSWKKLREKSGGHLYHHIHELDCIQSLMGTPETVMMTGGNVAHSGEKFGDEDDMLFINLEFAGKRYAVLEYGSAFRWAEHYLLIQGTRGAIRIDMQNTAMTLKTEAGEQTFPVHENQAEDDDRRAIYKGTEMDGAIMYGQPGKRTPLWLHSIMEKEMAFFHAVLRGETEVPPEFEPLLTGQAARASIATADALTLSLRENRKVSLKEVL